VREKAQSAKKEGISKHCNKCTKKRKREDEGGSGGLRIHLHKAQYPQETHSRVIKRKKRAPPLGRRWGRKKAAGIDAGQGFTTRGPDLGVIPNLQPAGQGKRRKENIN